MTNIRVDPAEPLVVLVATGEPSAVANACAYSLDGAVDVDVQGPLGFLSTIRNFSSKRLSVAVTDGTYKDSNGKESSLPIHDTHRRRGSARIQRHQRLRGGCNPWQSAHRPRLLPCRAPGQHLPRGFYLDADLDSQQLLDRLILMR